MDGSQFVGGAVMIVGSLVSRLSPAFTAAMRMV